MAIGTNIPVEDLQALVHRIQSEASNLEGQLNALRTAVTRDQNFSGSAATKYDEFLTKWDANQKSMLEDIRSAGQILGSLADTTAQNNDKVAASFG